MLKITNGKEIGYPVDTPVVHVSHTLTRSNLQEFIKAWIKQNGESNFVALLKEAGVGKTFLQPIIQQTGFFNSVEGTMPPTAGYKIFSDYTDALKEAGRLIIDGLAGNASVATINLANMQVMRKAQRQTVSSIKVL